MTATRRAAMALASLAAVSAWSRVASATGSDSDRLATMLRRSFGQYRLRSLLFAAWRDGRPILTRAIGHSAGSRPARRVMHFRAAAITTSYLGALLLHLVDRKQVQLDDPIAKWWPELPHARRVTLGMLGYNSSGYADYLASKPFQGFTREALLRHWTDVELIRLGTSLPLAFPPGTGFHYAHTNAVLLGAILERATGEPIARLLRRAFLAPLRLDETEYPSGIALRRPVLHAFSRQFDRYEDSTLWDPAWVSHSGLMNTDLHDLGRWARLLGSGAILSKRSYRALTAPINVGHDGNAPDFYYGLGVLVLNRWIVQNGLYFGWNPVMAYLPSQRLSLAIFTTIGPESEDGVSHGVRILKQAVRILAPEQLIPDRFA
ncbi:MAG: serine hydrolase domain-containing protein [Geminicoccaceae bacterium]